MIRNTYLTIDGGLVNYANASPNINSINGLVTIGGASIYGYDYVGPVGTQASPVTKWGPMMNYLQLRTGIQKQAGGAGTPGVWTLTPTAATGVQYNIVYTNATGKPIAINYTSPLTGSVTATTICNDLRTLISAMPQVKVTTSGTATLIITGATGFEFFTIGTTSDSAANWSSVTNTTPGVVTAFLGADLIARGVNATATLYYDHYKFAYNNMDPNGFNAPQLGQAVTFDLFVNTAASNLSIFEATLFSVINGLKISGSAIDPELISKD